MAALRGLHDRTEKGRLQLLAELGRTANPVRVRLPGDRGDTAQPAGEMGPAAAARPGVPAPVRICPRPSAGGSPSSFTDIDDTLTSDGMIPRDPYAALWDLANAGIQVVAVTGRPAGWCDHIARMWPVAGVVGENGAFSYVYDRARKVMNRSFADPGPRRARNGIGGCSRSPSGCCGRCRGRRLPPTRPSA